MKQPHIAIILGLTPALTAGQDQPPLSVAAKALLKRTRFGLAEITRQEGTQERAIVVRVTDRLWQSGTARSQRARTSNCRPLRT